MTTGWMAFYLLAGFFTLLALRVPVAFALGFVTLPVIVFDPGISLYVLINKMYSSFNSFLLLAVPFFLLAANVMNEGGITHQMFGFSRSLVGRYRGALAQMNVVLSFLFAGISGSATADAAAQSKIFIPTMRAEGYDVRFAVANTAAGSTLALIVPPSIIMIIWAGTLSVSIGQLYVAGILPGFLIMLGMMVVVYFYARKHNLPAFERVGFKGVIVAFFVAIPALMLPFIIAGGKIFGWFTATESAAVASVYAIVLGLWFLRKLSLKTLAKVFLEAAQFSSMVLFCLGTASIFGWLMAYYEIPLALLAFADSMNLGLIGTGFFVAIVFLIVGCFLDAIPAIVIVGTVLQPLTLQVDMAPLQYALIGIASLSVGLVTPPYGLSLLIASQIGQVEVRQVMGYLGLFLLPMLVVISLIIVFPSVFMWLPSFVG